MDKTYEEILRQYRSLNKTVAYFHEKKEELSAFFHEKGDRSVMFFGSGSSFSISQSAEIIARNRLGLNAFSVPAGDALVNFETSKKAFHNTIAVAITRSGKTTEVLKTAELLLTKLSVPVVSVSCVENPELGGISSLNLSLPWTFDESICQTGTVSNLYAAAALLLDGFADSNSIFDELQKLADCGDAFLQTYDASLKRVAESSWSKVVVLADGEISGLASEAALAFQEIARTDSNFYHVLDVRHGPMVMIDSSTLVLASLSEENREYQLDLVSDLIDRGANVVVYSNESYEEIPKVMLHVKHEHLGTVAKGLPFLNLAQLIAYYRALLRKIDPGAPEGLRAWIKLA